MQKINIIIILCRSSILLHIFCLLDLSYIENSTLKSPISVFYLCFCVFYFLKLVAVLFDSFWIIDFRVKSTLLCHIKCFWLKLYFVWYKNHYSWFRIVSIYSVYIYPFFYFWLFWIPFCFHGFLRTAYYPVLFCESN